ncbi:unnamed protein product [Mytilus coruscus]|uniref:Uncharacterized protein n=1 Tax=Mytilus coruscus TaxID=42192 RepID=A0A6J8BU76_MYTCO|nr:unnamed protein product [Mytilus coruscus]
MQPSEQGITQLPFGKTRLQDKLHQRVFSNVVVSELQRIYTPSMQPTENQALNRYSVCNYSTELGIAQLLADKTRLQEESRQRKLMILKLENEAHTREQDLYLLEQDLHNVRKELEQAKADRERNQGRNVSVSNFYGTTHVINCSSQDMALQLGNENRMINRAENVEHNPWESEN